MIIVVDIGNSRLKWGKYTNNALLFGGSVDYKGHALETIMTSICSHADLSSVYIANVAGQEVGDAINQWFSNKKPRFKLYFMSARATHSSGLVNGYSHPATLGVDRWLGMVAGWMTYQSAFCSISCGTAMTVDAVNKDGQHLGGLIIPGIELMQYQLYNQTAGCKPQEDLPFELPSSSLSILGQDTPHAIKGGALFAGVSFIERIVDELSAELDQDLPCIITGGHAPAIFPLLTQGFILHPYLVLEGIILGYSQEYI